MFICLLPNLLSILLILGLRQCSMQTFSNINLCTKEGNTLSHECTVDDSLGVGSTIWQGDSVESSNQISLLHSIYESRVHVVCGDFSAVSIIVNGFKYNYRLTIHGFLLNETTTINCTLSGVVVVKTIIVKDGGQYFLTSINLFMSYYFRTALPPSPGPLTVAMSDTF